MCAKNAKYIYCIFFFYLKILNIWKYSPGLFYVMDFSFLLFSNILYSSNLFLWPNFWQVELWVSRWQSFVRARKLTFVADSHNPFTFCRGAGPEVGKRTCLRHHYLHSSWLHLPEPPPTCLTLLRFMWLYRRRPIQCARTCVGFLLYWQLCVWYCSWLPVRLGPVYLESVISESLKRLGQFREDKWWIGRTADVETQTLQDEGVGWGQSPHCGGFLLESTSYLLQPLQMEGIIHSSPPHQQKFLVSSPFAWATLLLSSKQMIKNGYWVFTMSFV